jgi:putative nucleotidyltransferase with HDIG domain
VELATRLARRPTDRAGRLDERIASLIVALAAVLAGCLVMATPQIQQTIVAQPQRVASLFALTLLLQLFSVQVYARGSVSVSAIGILTSAFVLNTGTAMGIAVAAALLQWLRRRGQFYKAVFDAANFALSAGVASLIYHALGQGRLVGAVAAGLAYAAINNGLLCFVMSLAENTPWRSIWLERFHWARFHFLLFGPLALAGTIAYEQIGMTGLAAFALPPALMILSVRQYLERTAAAVDEVRKAVDEAREANLRLRHAHRETIAALSRSMEAKDLYTGGHTERVAAIATALARALGYQGDELEAIEIGALLHDVGKIGIPEQILRKEGPLDDEEWAIMRTHPVVSDHILAGIDLDPIVRQCARSSHERIDGNGYPDGLSGDQIPLPARIVFVADAYDALTSDRSYRPARPPLAAIAEIDANAGTQFCPEVVKALHSLWTSEPNLLTAEVSAHTAATAASPLVAAITASVDRSPDGALSS